MAIWSSAGDDYVQEIARLILPEHINPLFIWGQSKCVFRLKSYTDSDYYLYEDGPFAAYANYKILKKVKSKYKIPIERMLIVDDTAEKLRFNYGNAMWILISIKSKMEV